MISALAFFSAFVLEAAMRCRVSMAEAADTRNPMGVDYSHESSREGAEMKRTRRVALALMTMTAAALPGVAFAVTPANGGAVGGTTVAVDTTPGEQIDPHVSGELAAYTDQVTG
jgi:hypothetical protein